MYFAICPYLSGKEQLICDQWISQTLFLFFLCNQELSVNKQPNTHKHNKQRVHHGHVPITFSDVTIAVRNHYPKALPDVAKFPLSVRVGRKTPGGAFHPIRVSTEHFRHGNSVVRKHGRFPEPGVSWASRKNNNCFSYINRTNIELVKPEFWQFSLLFVYWKVTVTLGKYW